MYSIAITGVGGGVGQSIIKSLQDTDYKLIALDGDPLAVGLYAVQHSMIIPYASSTDYISSLLSICEQNKISLLFPGLDAELMPLAQNREAFASIGTTVVVSTPDVINVSDDKQATYDRLTAAGIKIPYTCSAEAFHPSPADFPLILKQKKGGARSKNIFRVNNLDEWHITILPLNLSDFIAMQYIEGDEYTCGTINLDNTCKGVIIMKRILRDGDTYKSFVVKDEVIESVVRKVVDTLKPFGACNVQLRVKDGIPYVFEINARCSGTTAARTLSGFNEPKLIADHLLKNIEPVFEIQEQTILRYWQELVVENADITSMRLKKGKESNIKRSL